VNKGKVTRIGLGCFLLAGAIFLVASPEAQTAGPPARKAKPVASDQLDYVFFASDRPILIRLHVRIGDQPYSVAWEAWMNKMFAWFDKNGDGFLNAAEAARIPEANFLNNQIQGGIGGRSNPMQLATLDTNKDGKVSKEEFRAYYRQYGMRPLRFFNNNFQATQAKQVNDAIYKRLGLPPTGKMTREALAKLQTLLGNLDENEDELLSVSELQLEGQNDPYGPQPVRRRGGKMPQQPMAEPGLIELQAPTARSPVGYATAPGAAAVPPPAIATPPARPAGSPFAAVAQQMLGHYDKSKKGKLSPRDIGFDKKLFDQLDRNRDGFLDASELIGFFHRQPDLVVRARVGKLNSVAKTVSGAIASFLGAKSSTPDRAEVLNAKTSTVAKNVKRVNNDNLSFKLGDSQFDLQANEGQLGVFNGLKQFYLRLFDSAVDKKKGYVVKAQEKENAQQPFLFYLFDQADKDADGKLTRKELVAWLDLVNEGGSCFVSVQVEDIGRSLFGVIDRNKDGQLSIREMRTAWERVKPLCKDGAGLEQKDLPRSLRITIGQGNAFFRGGFVAQPVGGPMTAIRRFGVGNVPAWFTKMDRNGDGDISPKEWLGTEEEFRMIDTDGDGLISADEARAYEARRKKEEPKPSASTKK
jgi:Ca2+-binding EF-hand superfamily protein